MDRAAWQRASDEASRVAHTRYCDTSIVPHYEAYYRELLDSPARR